LRIDIGARAGRIASAGLWKRFAISFAPRTSFAVRSTRAAS
jgi:hypothetical protein